MPDNATRKRLIGYVVLTLVVGVTLSFVKPALVDAAAQRFSEAPPLAAGGTIENANQDNAAANPAQPATNADVAHSFHVLYKRGFDEYVRGDCLTIENGSYVISENSGYGANRRGLSFGVR